MTNPVGTRPSRTLPQNPSPRASASSGEGDPKLARARAQLARLKDVLQLGPGGAAEKIGDFLQDLRTRLDVPSTAEILQNIKR